MDFKNLTKQFLRGLGQGLNRTIKVPRNSSSKSRPRHPSPSPDSKSQIRHRSEPLLPGATAAPSGNRTHRLNRSHPLPNFSYDPYPDNHADPGEVVWTWVPYEEDSTQGKDRPVLIMGRMDRYLVAVQLTSKDHDRDAAQEASHGRYWVDIGTGAWDRKRRPSEARVDQLLLIRPEDVRRMGAGLKKDYFDRVARAIKKHW